MTDAMFDMWQQAIALADSEDHSIDAIQSHVLNAFAVRWMNVDTTLLKFTT